MPSKRRGRGGERGKAKAGVGEEQEAAAVGESQGHRCLTRSESLQGESPRPPTASN